MFRLYVPLILVSAFLVVGVFYGSWYVTLSHLTARPSPDEWKNFYSLAGVGVAALSGVVGVLMSWCNLFAQAKSSKDLERVKRVLEKSIPAYGNLYSAANRYYRALAPLETGGFDLGAVEIAEGKMKDAEGETLFVSDEYGGVWFSFWQHVRHTKEKVNRDVHTVEERKKLWHEASKSLAKDMQEMKRIARSSLGD